MRKILIMFLVASLSAAVFSSCAATKRDCNGVIKHKQPGGFYM